MQRERQIVLAVGACFELLKSLQFAYWKTETRLGWSGHRCFRSCRLHVTPVGG